MSKPSNRLIVLVAAYFAFVVLGAATGLQGIALPSIQTQFGIAIDGLFPLFVAGTAGYLISSSASGPLAVRFTPVRLFIYANVLSMIGLFGAASAPSFWMLVVFAFIGGLGNGTVDAGINAYMAAHYGTRAMNWVHACFGLGMTLGAFLMTRVIAATAPWQTGYAIAGGAEIVLFVCLIVTASRWQGSASSKTAEPVAQASARDSLRMPMVWLSISLFVIYVAVEAIPNTWAFSLFTKARMIPAEVAGMWVSIFAASFTVGRIFFGAIANRTNPITLLRGCLIGSAVAALLLWWSPTVEAGFAALTLLGFAQAPIFAMLVLNTAERVGQANAHNTIGFQLAGAALGFAVMPSLVGALAEQNSLEIMSPFILGTLILLFVLNEISLVGSPERKKHEEVVPAAGD
jgi:fucose permease